MEEIKEEIKEEIILVDEIIKEELEEEEPEDEEPEDIKGDHLEEVKREPINYNKMQISELKKMAKKITQHDISKLKKPELIKLLEESIN
jgi:hypothetical protein